MSKQINFKKQNYDNARDKLFKKSEEIVSKINFFEPLNDDTENPYNLKKNVLITKDKNDSFLSNLIYLFQNFYQVLGKK